MVRASMCGSSASYPYGRAGSVNAIVFLLWFAVGRPGEGARELLRCARRLPLPSSHPTDDPRQERDQDDKNDHGLDVPVDPRNVATQEVTDEQHTPDPADTADQVEKRVATVSHLRHTGHDWHKR